MTVGTTLRSWSATAANNNPKGTDIIGTSADDELRQIQATVRQYLASQASSVVAAATTDLSAVDGHLVPISGNSTITGLGTEAAGIEYILNFSGSPILVHSSAFQLPGQATINATVGDMCVAESLGSGNWKVFGYTKANGKAVNNTANTQPTRQIFSSGSGTYTTPAGATRISVRAIGGGGGGAGNAAATATTGGNTTFSNLTASGGVGGGNPAGGAGGAASGGDINIAGGVGGGGGQNSVANVFVSGGSGGSTPFGSAGGGAGNGGGGVPVANTGAGGGGGGGASATNAGGGGGGGGYVDKLIVSPAATYSYGVGAGGAGTAGTASSGATGATGIIIVDEFYD